MEEIKDRVYWTQNFIKRMDDMFPDIDKECKNLETFSNDRTKAAFQCKREAWQEYIDSLQKLCRLYKIENAKCLSKKN